jgi:hypothetical protein
MARFSCLHIGRGLWFAAAILLLAPAAPAGAQQPLVLAGVYVESNYSVQPGLQVAYASPRLLGGAPRLTASASTTRFATAMGSNALVEDRLQLTGGWHFRRSARFSPYVAASGGYTRFDRDDDELFALLDNDAPLFALLAGAEARLGGPLRLHGHLGYSPVQSSTVYPLVMAAGLSYRVRGGAR